VRADDPTELAVVRTAAETAPGPVRPPTLQTGTLLAERYRIEKLVGKGGMGAVFSAHDELADRMVAVKLVGGRRTEIERERLREELHASMLLTHRNIARTHTLEEVDGEIFIVMELLAGETLAARIGKGPIPHDETLAITLQLLDALAEAHRHGVIHRDVKPANVMCCDDGRVVLMDFGVARIDDRDTSTHTTSIKGTPAYMAPEVVSGRRADPRADLYAVGLILFEMLTGEPPFKAATVNELLHRQLTDAIDTQRIHGQFAHVIGRATAKDPAARYATAGELRLALTDPLPRRNRRWIAATVALVAIVVGGSLAYALTRGSSDDSPTNVAVHAKPDAAVITTDPWATTEDPLLKKYRLESEAYRKALGIELTTELTALADRACTCKNLACARKAFVLLKETMTRAGKHPDFTVDDAPQTKEAANRIRNCLLNGGIAPKEMASAMQKILDEAPNQKKKP
jgi:serine/threonine protein kinase